MNNAKLFSQIDALPESARTQVEDFVAFLSQKLQKPVKKERQFGALKGMFVMSPDFDEPLEDFKDYM